MSSFSLSAQVDLDLIQKDMPAQRILEVVVDAPQVQKKTDRPGLNLALALDRSGSMSGEKLEFVKKAAGHVVNLLTEKDRLALVTYDNEVQSLSPSVAVTEAARAELHQLLRRVEPGGMTNLSGGWLQSCQFAASAAAPGLVNRSLLLTDGLANVGITDMEELGMHARQLHNRGIATSTFGVGQGYNEHLLELMANQGGGNFYYIADPQEIPRIFARELGELTAITARAVELEIELPPHTDAKLLGGWKQELDKGRLTVWLGDMASGQRREIYIQLLTPPEIDQPSLEIRLAVHARGENEEVLEEKTHLTLRYASPDEIQAAKQDELILHRFSEVQIAEAANEALKLERKGERERARQVLYQGLAAAAPHITAEQMVDYQQLAERMQRGLEENERKKQHYWNYQNRQRRS
ncbi:MAG: VWA domain-containing protein [Anaerolineaceae bacterium]|nr:VWA domain-containing protein [Anaerolineaceae bacterium]